MSSGFIKTKNGTAIVYKDWGRKDAQPIVGRLGPGDAVLPSLPKAIGSSPIMVLSLVALSSSKVAILLAGSPISRSTTASEFGLQPKRGEPSASATTASDGQNIIAWLALMVGPSRF